MIDPFVIHRVVRDDAGRIVDFSPAYGNEASRKFDRELGIEPGEEGSLDVHPRGANAGLFANCCAVVESGEPLILDALELNHDREGSHRARIIDLRIVKLDEGIAITGRDITRYVDAERALREVESGLKAQLYDRAVVLDSLARLRPGSTPESTAQAICEAMVRLPGIDRAAIVQFTGLQAVQLGSVMPPGFPLRAGDVLPQRRATYLRGRASQGPWVEVPQAEADDPEYLQALARMPSASTAFSPIIDSDDQLTGLVLMGGSDARIGDVTDLLPIVRQFAIAASNLLGSTLNDRTRSDRTRSSVARIIATGAFWPVYQPVVDMRSGRWVGYEALTRFANGVRPDVQFAEAHGVRMGVELEVATIAAALDSARQLPADAWLSLNVSPRLILDGSRLIDVLSKRSRPLVIEVTEHEQITDYGAVRAALARLGADVRLAVDDAGAGVANFNHIVELRPDFLKIDISLVRNLNTDLVRQAAVVGLLHFATATDRWIIAEGVETEAERDTLLRLNVHLGQGYLMSAPRKSSELMEAEPGVVTDLRRRPPSRRRQHSA